MSDAEITFNNYEDVFISLKDHLQHRLNDLTNQLNNISDNNKLSNQDIDALERKIGEIEKIVKDISEHKKNARKFFNLTTQYLNSISSEYEEENGFLLLYDKNHELKYDNEVNALIKMVQEKNNYFKL